MANRDDPTQDRRFEHTVEAKPRIGGAPRRSQPDERRFVIGDELGRGGMGRVVAATDTLLDREVAIKQALSDDVEAMRFEREARITAQLEHASIVPIHDVGRDETGRPFYIMRRIAGESLAVRIAAAPDAPTRLALVPRLVTAVDAVAFAHARGIIHRDIKPPNILLGEYGETLLIDWGLARRLDEPDQLGVSGTAGYMAPEQVRGERVDARADVYALGATLLDVLTGTVGRGLSSPTGWLEQAAAGTLPALEGLDPAIPAELVAIAGKALAPEPGDRYRDAGELAADLHAFLDGRLVAAHRYTPMRRLARFVRRHRVAVAVTALALAAVAAIGVIAILRVIDERDVARAARRDAADRADVLLLDRATGLARTDPTRAVALLATLSPSSAHIARARDIAAIAALHGIDHGRVAHDGAITALAIAPDRHSLLSAGGSDGTIQIHDLDAGTVRTVARGPRVASAIWTDRGATVTCSIDPRGLRVVDIASGAVRTLEPDAVADRVWAPGDGERVRLHDRQRRVVLEISTSGGEPRVLARDVVAFGHDGDMLAVAGAGTVRIVDASGEHAVARYAGDDPAAVAISGDGSRVAAAFRDVALEWDAATGQQRGEWPAIGPTLVYAGTRLLGANRRRDGQLDVLGATGTFAALAADWTVLWSTPAGSHIAVVDASGDLGLLGDDGDRELRFDRRGSRMLAGRPDSPYLAVGSIDGTIRWWDLRQFVAESHRLPDGRLCDVDGERIYVRALGEVAIVTRATGAVRTVESAGFSCLERHAGASIVAMGPPSKDAPSFDVIDGATGGVRHFDGTPIAGDAIYFTRGRTLYEVGAGEPVVRWTAPADVQGAIAGERALGFELEDGRLVRVDATSFAATTLVPPGRPGAFELGRDGSWWYAVGTRLFHGRDPIGELPSPPQTLRATASGDCIVMTEERSIWLASARGLERLAVVPDGRALAIGQRTIAMLRDDGADLAYLDTGERMAVHARDASDVRVLAGDRMFAIVRRATTAIVDLYTDAVPADPAELHGWLRAATNATVEPGNESVIWR